MPRAFARRVSLLRNIDFSFPLADASARGRWADNLVLRCSASAGSTIPLMCDVIQLNRCYAQFVAQLDRVRRDTGLLQWVRASCRTPAAETSCRTGPNPGVLSRRQTHIGSSCFESDGLTSEHVPPLPVRLLGLGARIADSPCLPTIHLEAPQYGKGTKAARMIVSNLATSQRHSIDVCLCCEADRRSRIRPQQPWTDSSRNSRGTAHSEDDSRDPAQHVLVT